MRASRRCSSRPTARPIQDTPKLTFVVTAADAEWTGGGQLREQIAEWTKQRGQSPRLYPGSLVWCLKKPGRELREKVELWLAWRRVSAEIAEATLGGDFDPTDRTQLKVADAEQTARDEVWGGYRFAVLADVQRAGGLEAIDLGAEARWQLRADLVRGSHRPR